MQKIELELFYSLIDSLRKEGVKMKDIAEYLDISASVLSSLYTTVIPRYFKELQNNPHDESLDTALSLVNNVSKKRLISTLPEMIQVLKDIKPNISINNPENPFIISLLEEVNLSNIKMAQYCGTYFSYSISSTSERLKIEPILIFPNENKGGIRICRLSAYGELQWGIGFVGDVQNMYFLLNERDVPPITPVSFFFHLPLYKNPKQIRGQYIGLDYNFIPIARRVLLIKYSDSTSLEEFQDLSSGNFNRSELTTEQQNYYDYTCQKGDYIKMCTIPSLQMDETDLINEKKILEL